MGNTTRPTTFSLREGRFDPDDELYLPPDDEPGMSPGGGLEDGTTSGTTGRLEFPGANNPVDDEWWD